MHYPNNKPRVYLWCYYLWTSTTTCECTRYRDPRCIFINWRSMQILLCSRTETRLHLKHCLKHNKEAEIVLWKYRVVSNAEAIIMPFSPTLKYLSLIGRSGLVSGSWLLSFKASLWHQILIFKKVAMWFQEAKIKYQEKPRGDVPELSTLGIFLRCNIKLCQTMKMAGYEGCLLINHFKPRVL